MFVDSFVIPVAIFVVGYWMVLGFSVWWDREVAAYKADKEARK